MGLRFSNRSGLRPLAIRVCRHKPKNPFPLRNCLRFWCGLGLRVTLRPKSLAICGRGWKATKSDTFYFLRHVMRAVLSVRPKCSHRCVSDSLETSGRALWGLWGCRGWRHWETLSGLLLASPGVLGPKGLGDLCAVGPIATLVNSVLSTDKNLESGRVRSRSSSRASQTDAPYRLLALGP